MHIKVLKINGMIGMLRIHWVLISEANEGNANEFKKVLNELDMIGMTKEMIDIKGGWKKASALMNAAQKGHGKIVEVLLDNGVNVDVRYIGGWQAIHFVTSFGHLDVVKLIANKHPKPLKVLKINGMIGMLNI